MLLERSPETPTVGAARRETCFSEVVRAFIVLLTLGSGLLNLYSASQSSDVAQIEALRRLFPLEFIRLSHFATLLIGLALIVSALNIAKRKRRAWMLTMVLCGSAVVFQILRAAAYEEAALSMGLFIALWLTRRSFTVRSRAFDWSEALAGLSVAFTSLLMYGIVGFYFLDKREFGIEFEIRDAIVSTLRLITFAKDAALVPHTRHAAWFLDSISVLSASVLVYSFYVVFKPALYQFRTHPIEVEKARAIMAEYGRSSLDFFKARPAKSLFFSPSGKCFLSYRVGGGFAIVLGDPVGPANEIAPLIYDFVAFCRDNDWRVCFYQALPDGAEFYDHAGLHKLKIGDDAIVDLARFTLEGSSTARQFRGKVKHLEKQGIRTRLHEPPLPQQVLEEARTVSDEWLEIPGHHEHGFSVGWFEDSYVRNTPLFVVEDAMGKMLAFANIIPSGRKIEATVDMMRYRKDVPNGIMDFLFVKLFFWSKERGFQSFTLGMAPMGGFRPGENAAPVERAVHAFVRHLNFLFSFQGLRAYKAKFASYWEPRYLYFQNPLDLPRIGIALRIVSGVELPKNPTSFAVNESERTRKPNRHLIRRILGWTFAVAALAWVFHDIRIARLYDHVCAINWWWVLPAVLCDISSYGFEGLRWGRLLHSLGRLPLVRAVQAIYAGLFVNEVLPMRVGDMVQVYLGSHYIGRSFATVLPSLMVGAVIDGLWIAVAAGIVTLYLPLPSDLITAARWFTLAMIVMGGVLLNFMIHRSEAVERWSRQPHEGWMGRLREFVSQVVLGLSQIRPVPDLILAYIYSAGILTLQALGFWLVMKAYGLGLPFYAGATVFLIVHLSTAIPNAPSNIGSYQLFTVFGLQMFGVDKTQAAGFSVVVFVLLTLPFWFIGVVALGRSGLRLKKIREDLHKWVSPAF